MGKTIPAQRVRKIRDLRAEGLSQSEIARRVKVSDATVSRIVAKDHAAEAAPVPPGETIIVDVTESAPLDAKRREPAEPRMPPIAAIPLEKLLLPAFTARELPAGAVYGIPLVSGDLWLISWYGDDYCRDVGMILAQCWARLP